jgi:hypothetical protein
MTSPNTMNQTLDTIAPRDPAPAKATRVQFMAADDKDMLRAARDLTKGLGEAKPGIYWPDMLISAGLGYAGIATAILSGSLAVQLAAGLVAALALYRALMFIHELTHIHRDALPAFRTGWNLLVGIPLLMPSFMYEGVHTIHHKRTQYGTVEDPEYLPLALMKPWSLPLFVIVAILAPVALIVRAAVLVPLGALIPAIRTLTWERFSSLQINPEFRRRPPEGEFAKRVRWQDADRQRGCDRLAAAGDCPVDPVAHCTAQPAAHAGRAPVGERGRGDDGDRAVPRFCQRAAPGSGCGNLGAGRPALSRAAPPDAFDALSRSARSAPAAGA